MKWYFCLIIAVAATGLIYAGYKYYESTKKPVVKPSTTPSTT